MKVTIIGAGYVGLTTGVALAYLGHEVTAVDKDERKLALLEKGQSPIHEPGLEQLLTQVRPRLHCASRVTEAVGGAEIIIIAVGTPSKPNGEADTHYVEEAAREVAQGLAEGGDYVLVVKSTVPLGANRRVANVVERTLTELGRRVTVRFASNPEFLREGFALKDTLYPDRIVVGSDQPEAVDTLRRMYRPILEQTFDSPSGLPRPEGFGLPAFLTTDPTSAEMIKYAANAFLALKISYINEVAGLCERVGADVTEVARGIGADGRIGPRFLSAGLGWGGSCFPKDTAALVAVASEYNYSLPIVQAAREVNWRQRQAIVEKLQSTLKVLRGRTIGVLGLSFKPNTDDIRDAPALDIIRLLEGLGAHVIAHDPVALENARRALSDLETDFTRDPYRTAAGADALVLVTEWDEYRTLDLERLGATMKSRILVDGRNFFHPEQVRSAGFTYMGVGL